MVKANELRIGNIVEANGKYFIVSGIMNNEVFYEDDKLIGNDVLKGIVLTPEILVGCGFIYENCGYWIKDFGVYFSLRNGLMLKCIERHTVQDTNIIGCRHLHQLQNLYYDLTLEELAVEIITTTIPLEGGKEYSFVNFASKEDLLCLTNPNNLPFG